LVSPSRFRAFYAKRYGSFFNTVRTTLAGPTELSPRSTSSALPHAFLDDGNLPLEPDANGRLRWWTYAGGAGNRVLAGLLEAELGSRVSPSNTCITFADGAAESASRVRQVVDSLAARSPFGWSDALPLVDPGNRSRISKFQPCLPEETEHELIARETMSIDDANTTLAAWRRALPLS